MNEEIIDVNLVAFENKVVTMARMLYPDISCYSAKQLDPIRRQLKEVEAKLKVPVEPKKAEEPPVEPIVKENEPEPKRRGRPPKR